MLLVAERAIQLLWGRVCFASGMLSQGRYRLAIACLLLVVVYVVIKAAGHKVSTRRESESSDTYKPNADIRPETVSVPIGVRKFHNDSVANISFRDTPPPLPKTFVPLSQKTVDRVRKFVFFIGWSRSGSSITGSILDAHQHIVIPHQYGLFEKWKEDPAMFYHKKIYLFNELYERSYRQAIAGVRKIERPLSMEGFTLNIKGMWQGQFKNYVAVIGDKQAAPLTHVYANDPARFRQVYKEVVETVGIQVVALIAVRNPFDMVARDCIDRISPDVLNMRQMAVMHKVYRDDDKLNESITENIILAKTIDAIRRDSTLNFPVLEIHNVDYVNDPKQTVQRICDFLEVECSEEYLQTCEDKAFKSTFRTRHLVEWPPELRTLMEKEIRRFAVYDRYSFESE